MMMMVERRGRDVIVGGRRSEIGGGDGREVRQMLEGAPWASDGSGGAGCRGGAAALRPPTDSGWGKVDARWRGRRAAGAAASSSERWGRRTPCFASFKLVVKLGEGKKASGGGQVTLGGLYVSRYLVFRFLSAGFWRDFLLGVERAVERAVMIQTTLVGGLPMRVVAYGLGLLGAIHEGCLRVQR